MEFAVSVDVLEGELEGVSVLHLQRPDARNALGQKLITELVQCLDTIRQEKSTRVLLIKSSVVGVFSAGADLKVSAGIPQFHRPSSQWREFRVWIVTCECRRGQL